MYDDCYFQPPLLPYKDYLILHTMTTTIVTRSSFFAPLGSETPFQAAGAKK